MSSAPRGAELMAAIKERGLPVEAVSPAEFTSAAETDSPQGVLALAEIPATTLDDVAGADTLRLLILDAVQDPGNVGTLVRTAAALGAQAVIALPGTVDLWNAKVVRSGMGAHFHFPSLNATTDSLGRLRATHDLKLWGADVHGDVLGRDGDLPRKLGIVVGNEGAGLSESVRGLLDRLVAVPIERSTESLNVAVAAGILLHQVRP